MTELACRDEGCPDIETVIGIMRPGEKIETIRVHKAIADMTIDDLGSTFAAVRVGRGQQVGEGLIISPKAVATRA